MDPNNNPSPNHDTNLPPQSTDDTNEPFGPAPVQPTQPIGQPPLAPQPASPLVQPHGLTGPKPSAALAITSMVLGIVGMLTGFLGIGVLLGLIAIILGVISLVKHNGGKGMAIAGVVTGGIAFVFGGLAVITLIAYNGIQERARESQAEVEQNALEQKEQKEELFGR